MAAGAPAYDPAKSLLLSNMGATTAVADLNFKAYKQEEVVFASTPTEKETTAGNPVFNTGSQQPSGDAALRLNNVKSVWGQSGLQEQPEAKEEKKSGPTFNTPGLTSTTQQKKKVEEPLDKKKEQMKNALFSGISSTKKDDSDSDEKKEEPKPVEAPVGEMDLLAFDDSPAPSQPAGGNLLDVAAAPGNLLD